MENRGSRLTAVAKATGVWRRAWSVGL